jgi:hypothetical protein
MSSASFSRRAVSPDGHRDRHQDGHDGGRPRGARPSSSHSRVRVLDHLNP